MGLVRTKEEIEKRYKQYEKGYELLDVTIVNALFATTMEAIETVLPPPLEPRDSMLAQVFVAEYHRTNFIPPYNEAAVFIPCQYEGEAGSYCLSMPVTTDIAMIGGREVYGYPKKIADEISVTREDNSVQGICVRRGRPIIEVKGKMSDVVDSEGGGGPHFIIKSILDEKGVGATNPLLVKQVNPSKFDKMEIGEGTVTFGESEYDYLHEIPVLDIIAVTYAEGGTIIMPPGKVVQKLDPEEYTQYHFIKYDWK